MRNIGRTGSLDRVIVRAHRDGVYASFRFLRLRARFSFGPRYRTSVHFGGETS